MNDNHPALHLRDVGAVHDAYAERLYAYCWSHLHDRGAAGLAVRDTLIWAQAHEPPPATRLTPWLYRIARAECARRRLPGAVRPDVQPARHDQDDALPRLLAWRAVARLPPLSRELLDLRHRHDLTPREIASVVGRPVRDVTKQLGRGRTLLESALVTQILAGSPPECPGRAAILRRGGDLLRHSRECAACGRRVPRNLSVAKVYGLLPCPTPPPSSRSQVLRALTDPALAHYRLLAVLREHAPRRGRLVTGEHAPRRRARRRARAAAAVLLAAAVTGVPWLVRLGDGPQRRGPAPRPAVDAHPVVAPEPVARPRAHAGLE